jgi:hypothetical protein
MVDKGASAEESEAVRKVLGGAGIHGSCTRSISLNAERMWLVMIIMPAAVFIESIAARAGKDGWREIKRFFEDLRSARNGDPTGMGEVVFRQHILAEEDAELDLSALPGYRIPGDRSTELMLTNGMPDRAYQSLMDRDMSEGRGVLIYWETNIGSWQEIPF